MSTHVVVARIAGLAGRTSDLRQLLADRALAARAESGCVGYEVSELLDATIRPAPSTSLTDPGRFG